MIYIKATFNDFDEWLGNRYSSYYHHFSYDAALAIFEYIESISEDTDEPIAFDPIAWCCEFTEYKNVLEAYNEYNGIADGDPTVTEAEATTYFEDNTSIICFEPCVIQNF